MGELTNVIERQGRIAVMTERLSRFWSGDRRALRHLAKDMRDNRQDLLRIEHERSGGLGQPPKSPKYPPIGVVKEANLVRDLRSMLRKQVHELAELKDTAREDDWMLIHMVGQSSMEQMAYIYSRSALRRLTEDLMEIATTPAPGYWNDDAIS